MSRTRVLVLLLSLCLLLFAACQGDQSSVDNIDEQLQALIAEHNVQPLQAAVVQDPAKVALGQALFFDKILSGNQDIACATCHHPSVGSGDGLSVSIGTGGTGLGPERILGYGRGFIPRNAPEVFNRGAAEWTSMFWDSRIVIRNNGDSIISPAGEQLPEGFDSILAVQAMFPVTSADEMRGHAGDVTAYGAENELALIEESDLEGIWAGLMDRLLAEPGYVELFEAAYPDVAVEDLGFQHAANAIAAFEIDAYTLYHTPWYAYLNGETDALTDSAKAGAVLFYGEANCVACHSGPLFTDQQHHNIASPQVGPGKGDEAPLDLGRVRVSSDPTDMYAFRTPPLHNVAHSGPYMHDGAFATLESVILHHIDPAASLENYDPSQHVPAALVETFQNDPSLISDMLANVDPTLAPSRELSDVDVQNLVAFLQALTDPGIYDLEIFVPDSVPSGLPVSDEAVSTSSN